MSQSRSLSKSSDRVSLSKPRRLAEPSLTPISIAKPSSSPILFDPKTTTVTGAPALQVEEGRSAATTQRNPVDSHRKRSFQYALFEAGDRDEDCETPATRPKILQTTWNYTPSGSASSNYLNERMLELSRVTRRAIAARMRYQHIRSHELDLIKSILEDETETSQKHMNGVDLQIGSLRNMLYDGGVAMIGDKGSRSDHNDYGQAWRESSDDDNLILGSNDRNSAYESDYASEPDA